MVQWEVKSPHHCSECDQMGCFQSPREFLLRPWECSGRQVDDEKNNLLSCDEKFDKKDKESLVS